MEMVPYIPYPLGIDKNWKGTKDLCLYLLLSTPERRRIQEMVDQQAWTGMMGGVVWIHHQCSKPLYLRYQQPDKDFQFQLLCILYNKTS